MGRIGRIARRIIKASGADAINKNQSIIDLLWDSLARDPDHKDRRQTGWGYKTQQGLIASLHNQARESIIDLLWDSLARDPNHKDRRQTGWGTKTQQGLIVSIERIMAEDFSPPPPPNTLDDRGEYLDDTTLPA